MYIYICTYKYIYIYIYITYTGARLLCQLSRIFIFFRVCREGGSYSD